VAASVDAEGAGAGGVLARVASGGRGAASGADVEFEIKTAPVAVKRNMSTTTAIARPGE
jgi:hypothetical protein